MNKYKKTAVAAAAVDSSENAASRVACTACNVCGPVKTPAAQWKGTDGIEAVNIFHKTATAGRSTQPAPDPQA
jgi:hypothetical protein